MLCLKSFVQNAIEHFNKLGGIKFGLKKKINNK